jgi:N utilization substance protein B
VADRQNQDEIFGYARTIVDGVIEHNEEIDDLLETYSQGWSLDRMPNLDRAILRVAVWEILHNDDVPDPVAINEAVELAKELSTDESGSFINGLLSRISSTKSVK